MISEKFTLEDIRTIRLEHYEREKTMTEEEIDLIRRNSAEKIIERIEKMRNEKRTAS